MKEIRDGCNKCGGPHPSSDCDDKPMGGTKEEEANYASGGYRGEYRGNYYGRNSGNWCDHQSHYRDENQSSNPSEENPPILHLPKKKPDESEFKKTMREFIVAQKAANDFVKNQFYNLKTKVEQVQKNHQAAIQDLEMKFGRISDHQSSRPTGTLPSNTQTNLKPSTSNDKPYRPPPAQNEYVNVVFTCSGKTYDPPVNPNAKPSIFLDDSEDEADEIEKEAEPLPNKPTHVDPPPLKAYKLKFWYPQPLHKEKIEARYAMFLDMINNMEQIYVAFLTEECSTILQNKLPSKLGDPRSFMIPCKFANSVEYLALADLGVSINLMPYSLSSLGDIGGDGDGFVVECDDGILDYNIVVINISLLSNIESESAAFERSMILSLGDIRGDGDGFVVESDNGILGIGEDRATFLIDKAMQHSHLNDDTCFRMDVIDEVTEDELDTLLDDFKPFLSTSEKISETSLNKEFEEFMTENVQEDEVKDDFDELPPKDELRIKTSIQDPPTDLEMKPLPKHLKYAFLEENSLLPVVISALLEQNEKERLILVLKNHKEAFAWKTSYIPGFSPSFCKHKINFEDDVKPVIQRQRRLNPNMKEVVKKEIIKLLDVGIIYAIEDSPWDGVFVSTIFDIEIKNKKRAKNVATDHLSRLEKSNFKELREEEINDEFPDEFLIGISTDKKESLWFADFANYLVRGILRKGLTYAQRFNILKKLFSRFRILKALISDRGTHFYNRQMEKILKKYGAHHRIATTYHPQTSGQLHELDELRIQAYKNSKLYKTRTKAYHDKKLRVKKEFKAGDKVLLYNSKYKFKAPKLRSKRYGPFIVKHGYPSGYVELYDKHEGSFIVNIHQVKLYHDEEQLNELTTEEIHLMCEEGRMKAIPFMAPFPANYRETMPWASEKPYIYSVVENTCNEAKLYDLDETGKGIVIKNILYVPSKGISLGNK
ncbi:reverse transcriptase domain-containing protein [Tanacetum coccineum]